MRQGDHHEAVGCERCWPSQPEAAWASVRALPTTADIVDESHYHVTLRRCPECSQPFLSVFTETIDWMDGEDPQHFAVLPLTLAEAAELANEGPRPTEAQLNDLAVGRRSLHYDYPKSGAPRTYWTTGMVVQPHD